MSPGNGHRRVKRPRLLLDEDQQDEHRFVPDSDSEGEHDLLLLGAPSQNGDAAAADQGPDPVPPGSIARSASSVSPTKSGLQLDDFAQAPQNDAHLALPPSLTQPEVGHGEEPDHGLGLDHDEPWELDQGMDDVFASASDALWNATPAPADGNYRGSPISRPPITGFAWANNKACTSISADALARARRLLDGDGAPDPRSQPAQVAADPARALGGFATAAGAKLAVPSDAARSKAEALFRDIPSQASQEVRDVTAGVGFQTAAGGNLAPLNPEALRRAEAALAGLVPADRADGNDASVGRIPAHSRVMPNSAVTTTVDPPRAVDRLQHGENFRTPVRPATAFRAPTRVSESVNGSTPEPRPLAQSTNAHRRMNLVMTPRRATPKSAPGKSGFSTPFKGGVRPPGLQVYHSARTDRVAPVGPPKRSRLADTEASSVFDLSSRQVRRTMSEAGLLPHALSIEDLIDHHVPNEVIFMTYRRACDASVGFEKGPCSVKDAWLALREAGCSESAASLRWVGHHHPLILVKLAAMIRWDPTRLQEYWAKHALIAQLKYRYEREYNRAERSAVKRIQEQDSPAFLPMCLYVSLILETAPVIPANDPDEDDASLLDRGRIIGIELSDGWYRIRCDIDITLKKAIRAKKIVEGTKLAISGARLEASRDGTDVLDAIDSSKLSLGANCVSRAPWDEPLGFRRHPWIASLRSLHPEGGVVPLVDVVVLRVFPAGFVGPAGVREAPWDLAEETRRQEAWETKRASELERLQQRHWHDLEIADALLQALRRSPQAAVHASAGPEKAGDVEEPAGFSDLLRCQNRFQVVRSLSEAARAELLETGEDWLRTARDQGAGDLSRSLDESTPARQVRKFCVVRIADYQTSRMPATRTAQLTVWDLSTVGDGFITEGTRYRITNLAPQQPNSWRGPDDEAEIMLGTRRNTRWTPLSASIG